MSKTKQKTLKEIVPTILEDQLNKDLKEYWGIYCKECLTNQDDLLTAKQIELGKTIQKRNNKVYYEAIYNPEYLDYLFGDLVDFKEGFEKYMIDKYTKNPPKPIIWYN